MYTRLTDKEADQTHRGTDRLMMVTDIPITARVSPPEGSAAQCGILQPA